MPTYQPLLQLDPGDRVAIVRQNDSTLLVTARRDGSIPLNSKVICRFEECAIETAAWIADNINSNLETIDPCSGSLSS